MGEAFEIEKEYRIKDIKKFREDIEKSCEKGKRSVFFKEIADLSINTVNHLIKGNNKSDSISEKNVKKYFKLFTKVYKETIDNYSNRFEDPSGVRILLADNGEKCIIQDIPKETDKIIVYLENLLLQNNTYQVLLKRDNCMQIKVKSEINAIFVENMCDTLTVWAFKEIEEEKKEILNKQSKETELYILIHDKYRENIEPYKKIKNKCVTIIEVIVDKKFNSIKGIRCLRRKNNVYLYGIFSKQYEDLLSERQIPMMGIDR